MEFGCCSRFKECSEVGLCISKVKELKDNCLYRIRLKQGFNFYSETYKQNKFYITIGGRQFYIGKRSSYGSYTYGLDENSKNIIKPYLDQQHISYSDEVIFSKCQVEDTSEDNRAYCIVTATIDNTKYNISNLNIRALTKETASSIKNFLVDKEIPAYVEVVGKKSSGLTQSNIKNHVKKSTDKVHEKSNERKQQKILTGQISIFDLQVVQDKGYPKMNTQYL